MAGAGKKWALGCGIGCVVVILFVAMIAVSCGLFLRSSFRGLQEAKDGYEQIVARFGEIEDYTPPADGAVPARRMELFLAVRDSMRAGRAELEALFADFPPDEFLREDKPVRKVLSVIKGMGDVINPVGEHISRRLAVLIDREMSLGEYLYIYGLAYYSWLGHSPSDGPVITKEGSRDRGERIFSDDDSTFGPRQLMRRYRRFALAMLRNQLASLMGAGATGAGAGTAANDADAWRRELTEEIARLEANPGRVMWQDGLPEAIEASLRPYRDRLEAAYSATTNCFELPPENRNRWHNMEFKLDIGD